MEFTSAEEGFDVKTALKEVKEGTERNAAALIHPYGFGYGCEQTPKGSFQIDHFGADSTLAWTQAEMSSLDEFFERSKGHLRKKYPKRCLKLSGGVTWGSSLAVSGAGIEAVNGLYSLDPTRLYRYAPVWHHESGACDAEWDGVGGGATIYFDNTGSNGGGGLAFVLMYKGGIRYINMTGDNDQLTPSSKWIVAWPGHSFDGVTNEPESPPPITRHPDWNEGMENKLQEDAAAEANYDASNLDTWIVGLEDTVEAESCNWVFKAYKVNHKLKLYRDGVEILKKIKFVKQVSSTALSTKNLVDLRLHK